MFVSCRKSSVSASAHCIFLQVPRTGTFNCLVSVGTAFSLSKIQQKKENGPRANLQFKEKRAIMQEVRIRYFHDFWVSGLLPVAVPVTDLSPPSEKPISQFYNHFLFFVEGPCDCLLNCQGFGEAGVTKKPPLLLSARVCCINTGQRETKLSCLEGAAEAQLPLETLNHLALLLKSLVWHGPAFSLVGPEFVLGNNK